MVLLDVLYLKPHSSHFDHVPSKLESTTVSGYTQASPDGALEILVVRTSPIRQRSRKPLLDHYR